MRLVVLASIGLATLFITGCSFLQSSQEPKKVVKKTLPRTPGDELSKAPKTVDWQGYYHGKLPCYNCQGIDTWLKLSVKDGRTVYDLREKFLGRKNVTSQGGVGWLRDGAVAQLLDVQGKYLFLGNGTATFINSPQSAIRDAYTLEKFDVFKNANAALLVNPQTIQAGKMGGKMAIKFIGITNYEIPSPSGYKSLRSTYLLKCNAGEFQMSRIAYYDKKFTMGHFVYPKENASGRWFSVDNSDIMKDIKNRYCAK